MYQATRNLMLTGEDTGYTRLPNSYHIEPNACVCEKCYKRMLNKIAIFHKRLDSYPTRIYMKMREFCLEKEPIADQVYYRTLVMNQLRKNRYANWELYKRRLERELETLTSEQILTINETFRAYKKMKDIDKSIDKYINKTNEKNESSNSE